MITDADVKKLKSVFATKDDLKRSLDDTKKEIVKELTVGLDRLEKTVGGFPPLTS